MSSRSLGPIAKVTIIPEGRMPVEFSTLVTSLQPVDGAHNVDLIPNTAGGRIPVHKPAEDGKITLELYPTGPSSILNTPNGPSDIFLASRVVSIDDMTGAASWTPDEAGNTLTDNITTFKYGDSSINVIKGDTGDTLITMTKTISSVDLSVAGVKVAFWVYCSAAGLTALDLSATGKCYLLLGTGGVSAANQYNFGLRLKAGWNYLEFNVLTDKVDVGGGADETDIDTVQVAFNTDAIGTTTAAGDVIVGYLHYIKNIDKGLLTESQMRVRCKTAILVGCEPDITGVATIALPASGGNTLLTYALGGWTSDALIGRRVVFTSGTALGKEYVISDNTATTITVLNSSMYDDGARTADTFKIVTTGIGALNNGSTLYNGMRTVYSEGYITNDSVTFSDMVLKSSLDLNYPPFNKAGTGLILRTSNDANAVLAAYTNW